MKANAHCLFQWVTRMAVLMAAGLIASPRPATAQEPPASATLEEIVLDAAKSIADLAGKESVMVGQIVPSKDLENSNGGPGIERLIEDSLRSLKTVTVLPNGASFEVTGSVFFVATPSQEPIEVGLKVIRLNLKLTKAATGEESSVPITRFIKNNTQIIRIVQPSGSLPLDPTKPDPEQRAERNKTIQELLKNPQSFIDPAHPSLVSSAKESPYKVEILAGPLGDGSVRPTRGRDATAETNGLPFVNIARGEVYEIRIHNTSPGEVAAQVFIDNIGVFAFSDDHDPNDPSRPKYSHVIIPGAKGGEAVVETIPGWHKSLKSEPNYQAFLVTAYGQGASSKLGQSAHGKVGVIQVLFSRCFALAQDGKSKSPGNETGFGPGRNIEQEEAHREIEPPIDSVSVRYTR
ncbi:hypothetical protein V5E97_29440 [Singulisphaera sp. Ch08]|uniref:DUF4384 domain-containing protein n=1 Tax=Singulisphaera sp. Ch08 TaxID=3120278 RepID=A0AAU7CB88_9BACT